MDNYNTLWLIGGIILLFAVFLVISRLSFYGNMPYERRNLLTKTEYAFWKVLQKKADENHLRVCPKVRMEDFLSVNVKSERNRMAWRGRIKSRHIDFILCDMDLHMIAGVELDDNTHIYNKQTKEIDKFKDAVFKKIDIPLFRVSVNKGNYEAQLDEMLDILKTASLIQTNENNTLNRG